MIKHEVTVRFLTPAFLGDADQKGAWRAPPFKAQLRQWWRVVMACRGLQWEQIRAHEAQLFGNAWPGQTPCKSRVRLRLSKWQAGKLTAAPSVGNIANGKNQIDGALYLGYGAIDRGKLVHGSAIDAGESADLRVGLSDPTAEDDDALTCALGLMNRFGALGGRSRNGWGSFALEGNDLPQPLLQDYLIDWRDALSQAWVRGIGRDDRGPLVWRTRAPGKNWQLVLRQLAQLRSNINRSTTTAEDRVLLSHPVTKKSVRDWSSQLRLPNSLRFKVVNNAEQPYGLVFHMPCRPTDKHWEQHPHDTRKLTNVWQHVHGELDNENNFDRVSA